MGSEQSHQQGSAGVSGAINESGQTSRLQRGNTIAATSEINRRSQDDSSSYSGSRPASPPISVCSDSDLPYISYTDRPIGDSPKIRSKGPVGSRSMRSNSISSHRPLTASLRARQQQQQQQRLYSANAHNIVIVRPGAKDQGIEKDPDIQKLQNIPMFLPVMRNSLSLPTIRDPEILDRLPSVHLQNICSRMQTHFNVCANQIASDQVQVMTKIKEVDQQITKLTTHYVEKQKAYANYAEQFLKIRSISQQLTRCNTLLLQNIESLEILNSVLDVEDRLEPFVWKTD